MTKRLKREISLSTIMMSESLKGRLDPNTFISDEEPKSFCVKISIGNRSFSCEMDKILRSGNKTSLSFFADSSLTACLMRENFLADVSVCLQSDTILSFSSVRETECEVEISLKPAGSHINMSIWSM